MDIPLIGLIIGRSHFTGSTESRVLTPGSALELLESYEGPADLVTRALSAPYVDVIMDDTWDDFSTWSARSVTVLPVVCSVEHDGGFSETV